LDLAKLAPQNIFALQMPLQFIALQDIILILVFVKNVQLVIIALMQIL